ncbi:MAG: DNA-binding response regulator [Spirochaetaceae bacterium]|nr:MAG: DNA-binding response regulator [Spirochaetaceae bacterium]
MALSVMIADDHQIVRRSLRRLIEDDERFTVVGEAGDGRTAVRRCVEMRPDVAVLDINMPVISGITATSEIKKRCPGTGVVILTFQLQLDTIRAALAAGAEAYVLKDSSENELFDAIVSAAQGNRYIAQRAAEILVDALILTGESATSVERDPLGTLSSRERQVLQMLAEGTPNNEIAATLNLSSKTVETYRSRLMQKLNVRSFAELVRIAVREGLVDQEG